MEPNAEGDTSQSRLSGEALQREPRPCGAIHDGIEGPATIDPWVDILDSHLVRDAVGELDAPGDAQDPYLSTEGHQDASNRPGPGQHFTEGKVGVYTDLDDDGTYDRAHRGWGTLDDGAYPMLWDMWLDEEGEPDPEQGCGGWVYPNLSEEMAQAGYGPATGLIQVVYLSTPTDMHDRKTKETIAYPDPDTAYVFLNQAMRQLQGLGNATVQAEIEDALREIPGVDEPEDVRTAYPATEIGAKTDFFSQCASPPDGFTNRWSFFHEGRMGDGATIVTKYVWENQAPEGIIAEDTVELQAVEPFGPDGEPYAFPTGINVWTDIDPIDGDPDRNTDGSSAPPH